MGLRLPCLWTLRSQVPGPVICIQIDAGKLLSASGMAIATPKAAMLDLRRIGCSTTRQLAFVSGLGNGRSALDAMCDHKSFTQTITRSSMAMSNSHDSKSISASGILTPAIEHHSHSEQPRYSTKNLSVHREALRSFTLLRQDCRLATWQRAYSNTVLRINPKLLYP